MTESLRLRVVDLATHERPVRLRLPFRFGIVTMTQTSQLFVSVTVADGAGRSARGRSASVLAPKWFDKNPALSNEDNAQQLRNALQLAGQAYQADRALHTPFGLHAAHYRDIVRAGAQRGLEGLVSGFGPALLDAAIIDAAGRLAGRSFYQMARHNLLGFAPADLAPDLAGFDVGAWLATLQPAPDIALRHTVGLVDQIDGDGAQAGDGQPETLAEVVRLHRPHYFKLKVGGHLEQDLQRLRAIAQVLDRGPVPYRATLDGNEQFHDAAAVLALWQAVRTDPLLARLSASVLFVEQPIHRAGWRDHDVAALAVQVPVIIDESDDSYESFVQARALGYRGVSSKLCKGLYKSLVNAARCAAWSVEGGAAGTQACFMSAEDLTNQAGLAVQQDLALVNLLGVRHVERNGHHYVNGFGDTPIAQQDAYLAHHPDLYERTADGRVRLRIRDGMLAIGSLDTVGFASACVPDAVDGTAADRPGARLV